MLLSRSKKNSSGQSQPAGDKEGEEWKESGGHKVKKLNQRWKRGSSLFEGGDAPAVSSEVAPVWESGGLFFKLWLP